MHTYWNWNNFMEETSMIICDAFWCIILWAKNTGHETLICTTVSKLRAAINLKVKNEIMYHSDLYAHTILSHDNNGIILEIAIDIFSKQFKILRYVVLKEYFSVHSGFSL